MEYCYIKDKKVKLEQLKEQILLDSEEFENIIILCLGKYETALSPFLTFATKVGTILKLNNFPVYGEEEHPILIDKIDLVKTSRDIIKEYTKPFVLVVLNSITDHKKRVGNCYYEATPYINESIVVGDAHITMCGTFGTNEEDYYKNSLNVDEINTSATDLALVLMRIIEEKQNTLTLKKELVNK